MQLLKRFFGLAWVLLIAVTSAQSATFTWTGSASTDWFDPGNWSPNGVPGSTDTAVISSGAPQVGIATNVGTVNLSGGTLTGRGAITITGSLNWCGETM